MERSHDMLMKRGPQSTFVHLRDGAAIDAAPFQVEVYNLPGASDAFASGFIYGCLKGWDCRAGGF